MSSPDSPDLESPPSSAGAPPGGAQTGYLIVSNVHALLIFAQPFLAGASLDGSMRALDVHFFNGVGIMCAALVQIVAATIWTMKAAGPRRALTLSAAVLGMETVQFAVGAAGALVVHLPLGILTLVVAVLAARLGLTKRRTG